jgi:hypothetical protein
MSAPGFLCGECTRRRERHVVQASLENSEPTSADPNAIANAAVKADGLKFPLAKFAVLLG